MQLIYRRVAVLVAVATFGITGCGESPEVATPTAEPPEVDRPLLSAREVLRQMVDAYQDRSAYSDQGVFRLAYLREGNRMVDEAPFAVRFAGPNKLSIEAYQATVACDGQLLRAQLRDAPTNDLDGQVLVQRAAKQWSLDLLFQDDVLRQSIAEGLGRHPLPLELLLESKPLQEISNSAETITLLDPQTLRQRRCHRVAVRFTEQESGQYVFWIDQESKILHRLEYPVEPFVRQVADPAMTEVEIVADFHEATFQPTSDSDFQFEMRPGAVEVSRLLIPPRPLASDLLGQKPAPFWFTSGNERLSAESLFGRVSVLLWFNDHPVCQAAIQQLDQVYSRFQSDSRVKIAAVSTEPSAVSSQRIAELVQTWNVKLPWVRDLSAFGRDVFEIPGAPTLVVIGGAGRVQLFQVGLNPALGDELPSVIERILAGQDLANETLAQHRAARQRYDEHLAGQLDVEQLTSHAVRPQPRSFAAPSSFLLRKVWETQAIPRPGNLLFRPSTGNWLAIAGGREIVEMDARGQVQQTWQLPTEVGSLDVIRSGVDSAGEWYVGYALRGEVIYVFDERWQLVERLLSEQEGAAVLDAQLGDLNNDRELDVIVSLVGAGISPSMVCLTRTGHRVWEEALDAAALSIAIAHWDTPSTIIATDPSGQVSTFDGNRQLGEGADARPRLFHVFAADRDGPIRSRFCGISFTEDGSLEGIGLGDDWKEVWRQPLAAGTFQAPIQFVESTRIGQHGFWMLAAPDGAVHFVREDGQFRDSLATGDLLTGLATQKQADGIQLLLAAESGLTCWSLQLPEPK